MNHVRILVGFRVERLRRDHARQRFRCGEQDVDDWLSANALQQQEKHLSVTTVLVDSADAVAGYYTLASGQVDFADLPMALTKRLPRRMLPVAVLAWFGISVDHQGQGLGRLLLARALRECFDASKTFAFVAVIVDCVSNDAKKFYQQWDFEELPGHPNRLFLSAKLLDRMMKIS